MQNAMQLSKLQDVYNALEIAAKNFGLKRLAPEANKSYSALANEISRQPNYKLGLSTVAIIIARTGDMRPLSEFCSIFNHVAVPIPTRPFGSTMDLWTGLSDMAMEFAQTTETFIKAMSGGTIGDEEKRRCSDEIGRLVDTCLRVKTWLLPISE